MRILHDPAAWGSGTGAPVLGRWRRALGTILRTSSGGGLEYALTRRFPLGKFLQAWCIGSILILLFTTLQGVLASAGSSLLGPAGSKLNHVMWGFVATVIVLFAHTITMFYFIGTGSAIKQEAKRIAALVPLYQRTRGFKAQTSGLLTLAPLVLMAASIVGAGAAGGSIRRSVHLWMSIVAVVLNVYTLWKASRVIESNIALMKEANQIVAAHPS